MRNLFASLLILLAAVPARAQEDPLVSARELYASARYDEALAALNSMRVREDTPVRPADVRALEQVRSLCLLALGRASEAEEAISAVVAVDPFYQPGDAEAAPRVRAAFQDVRRRMLPDIAVQRYGAAKASYDAKDYAAAAEQFKDVIALLQDGDMQGRHGDLRTLAGGFLELSNAAVKAAEAAKAAEAPPPPPQAPVIQKTYTAEDPGISLPVALRQDLPRVPTTILMQARDRGLIEITIDELGRVESAAVRLSVHPAYDAMLLGAASEWRYRPATVNGQPVKFRKRIQITVSRQD